MWLAAEQQPPVMLGKHDHHRVDPREMLRPASTAAPRPAAAEDRAGRSATEQKPWRECQLARLRAAANNGASVTPSSVSERERASGPATEAGSAANRGAPWSRPRNKGSSPVAADQVSAPSESSAGSAVGPDQGAGFGRGEQGGDSVGPVAQRIGAVDPGTGEEWLRRQAASFARASPRRRGGIKRRQAGLAKRAERLPPAFALARRWRRRSTAEARNG